MLVNDHLTSGTVKGAVKSGSITKNDKHAENKEGDILKKRKSVIKEGANVKVRDYYYEEGYDMHFI